MTKRWRQQQQRIMNPQFKSQTGQGQGQGRRRKNEGAEKISAKQSENAKHKRTK